MHREQPGGLSSRAGFNRPGSGNTRRRTYGHRRGGIEIAEDHGPSIKDDERYEALREEGASKEKAARIANTGCQTAGERGGKTPEYEELSVGELRDRATRVGIEGRSKMNKGDLIEALRNH